MQAGAVDDRPHAAGLAAEKLDGDAPVACAGETDDRCVQLEGGAARACGAGECVDEGDGVCDRLSGDHQRAILLGRDRDAVALRVLGQTFDRRALLIVARCQPGAAPQHRHGEVREQLLAQRGRAQDQTRLQRPRLGIEARVQDSRVGSARGQSQALLSL